MASSNPSALQPFLKRLEDRSVLGFDEQQAFLNLPFEAIQVRPNQDFVRQGEQLTNSCFVVEGVIGSFKQDLEGNRQIVAIFINGDMVDLHSAVVPEAPCALQALTDTKILKVPHVAIRHIAHKYPVLCEALWRHCVVDAGILMEWIVNVGRRDAKTRMAHFFCEIACRVAPDEPKDGMVIPYPITQFQLSDILGLTAVHINRTLQALRSEDLLESVERSMQRILDWDGLVAAGDFNPAYLHLDCVPQSRAA